MSDVSKFNIEGSDVNIKDATARTASGTSFDNTGTGLSATDVESVIIEVDNKFNFNSTLTKSNVNANLTVSSLTIRKYGSYIIMNGTIACSDTIPVSTTLFTLNATIARDINIPLLGIGGLANKLVYINASGSVATGGGTSIPAGSYIIDTIIPIN